MIMLAPKAAAGSTFTLSLLRIATRALKQVVVSLKHRRQVLALSRLDDRLLKDIGVSRSDIDAALSGPLHRDPSRHLVHVTGHGWSRSRHIPHASGHDLPSQGMGRLRCDAAPVIGMARKAAAC